IARWLGRSRARNATRAQWLHAAECIGNTTTSRSRMTERQEGLDAVRTAEFSALGESAYLNAASLGPLPERTRIATVAYAEVHTRVQSMAEEDFIRPPTRARNILAGLIGASAEEIALGPNTSFGINLAALGLKVPNESTVLVSQGEFPAVVYPWMDRP